MMGKKERSFAPLINGSLEELVPQDHFYRHLERTLDLSFVREFVQEKYAGKGRPSVDPVVFFKLQLVMFFEGIRSERQLMRHAVSPVSVSAMGSMSSAASLTRLWSSVKRRDSCGAKSCTSMAPRWQPMRERTRSSRAFMSMRIWIVCSVKHPRVLSRRASQRKVRAVLPISRRRGQHLRNFPPRSHLRSRSPRPGEYPAA